MEFMDLPSEILERIILLLPHEDRLTTRLVNTKLLEINNLKSIAKHRRIVCRDLDSFVSPTLKIVKLATSVKAVENLSEAKTDNSFWKKHGEDISSVHLHCNDSCFHKILYKVCENCPNLEDLEITIGHQNLLPASENSKVLQNAPTFCLKTLKVSYIDTNLELDPVLQSLLANASALQSLEIRQILKEEENNLRLNMPLLKDQLRKLTLNRNVDVKELFAASNKLTHFSILSKNEITDDVLKLICKNSQNLQAIRFHANHLTKPVGTYLSTLLNLTHVSFQLADSLDDDSVGSLACLSSLQCFEINNSNKVTDEGLINLFGAKLWPLMRHIHLNEMSEITNKGLERILPNLPNITVLNLQQCAQLKNSLLSTVLVHNCQLKVLFMHVCFPLKCDPEQPPLLPGLNNLKQLTYLMLSSCTIPTLFGLKLSKLKYLITSRNDFDMATLEKIFCDCLSLNYVFTAGPYIFFSRYDRMLRANHMFIGINYSTCDYNV